MEHKIEHHVNGNGLLYLALMWMLNIITLIDRGLVTFVLGSIVTVLAGYYYLLQIKKLRKENKKNSGREKTHTS